MKMVIEQIYLRGVRTNWHKVNELHGNVNKQIKRKKQAVTCRIRRAH
jgi:23S rRNA maturation mini-RNase III